MPKPAANSNAPCEGLALIRDSDTMRGASSNTDDIMMFQSRNYHWNLYTIHTAYSKPSLHPASTSIHLAMRR
jgi:hypothetical protein